MSSDSTMFASALRKYENTCILRFTSRLYENCLSRFAQEKLIGVVLQRRHLSCLFASFCDLIYPTLVSSKHREIVQKIVAEEYGQENHREAYVRDLNELGVTLSDIRSVAFTDHTLEAGRQIISYGLRCSQRNELYALCSLRFFSELLVGQEFMFFYKHLFLTEDPPLSSAFFGPHIHWDLDGSESSHQGHADRYLKPILSLIHSEQDLATAREAIVEATYVRAYFYSQYAEGLKMSKQEIKKATQYC